MRIEATERAARGEVVVRCACGRRLRVAATTWRVQCPCGGSAVLAELLAADRASERAADVAGWP